MHVTWKSVSVLHNKETEHSEAVSTKGGRQESPGQLGTHTEDRCTPGVGVGEGPKFLSQVLLTCVLLCLPSLFPQGYVVARVSLIS